MSGFISFLTTHGRSVSNETLTDSLLTGKNQKPKPITSSSSDHVLELKDSTLLANQVHELLQTVPLSDIPLQTPFTIQADVDSKTNAAAISIFVPEEMDLQGLSPGRVGGPPKDGPCPFNMTISTAAATLSSAAGSILSLYEYARTAESSNPGEDTFDMTIRKTGIAFGMIFGLCVLGSLYKKRDPLRRVISMVVGVSTIAFALKFRSQGFPISGSLCALSSLMWTCKTKPHQLVGACWAKIFKK